MGYKVATEGTQSWRSRRVPAGPGPRAAMMVPSGVAHAVDPATRRVACGRSLAGLILFEDRDWTPALFTYCRACMRATGFGPPVR